MSFSKLHCNSADSDKVRVVAELFARAARRLDGRKILTATKQIEQKVQYRGQTTEIAKSLRGSRSTRYRNARKIINDVSQGGIANG